MHVAETLFAHSNAALNARDFAQAESLLEEALQADPQLAEAHANLAWLMERRGAVDEAISHYEQAVALQPFNTHIHLNFGALLACRKHHQAAEATYRHVLSLDPHMPGAWCNLGALQAQTSRDVDAEASLRTAMNLDATHAAAHFNLACLLLRKGRFDEAWQHLEFRDCYQAIATRLPCPRWQGQPLQGRSILVVYEAGYGDMIQFCRYVSLLRHRGAAQVDLLCHPALKTLLQSLQGVSTVMGFDESDSGTAWDYWVPVMSLPFHFGTHMNTIPAELPYLYAPAEGLAYWHTEIQRQCPGPALRIGLAWHGNPAFANDAERSLPGLHTLAPLWAIPGLQFVSLQKGRGEQEVQRLQQQQPLADVAAHIQNFSDTAAVIAQLDLVISVDTAVAHLAGALGKPCWLLLPAYLTDWRWLEARVDSPWYPGVMRLFRQQHQVGWAPLIAEVHEALTQLTGSRPQVSNDPCAGGAATTV